MIVKKCGLSGYIFCAANYIHLMLHNECIMIMKFIFLFIKTRAHCVLFLLRLLLFRNIPHFTWNNFELCNILVILSTEVRLTVMWGNAEERRHKENQWFINVKLLHTGQSFNGFPKTNSFALSKQQQQQQQQLQTQNNAEWNNKEIFIITFIYDCLKL